MAIVKKPKKTDAADAFIAGAPDASQPAAQEVPTVAGVMRGARRQIALTFPPATIDQIDATASSTGPSGASYTLLA